MREQKKDERSKPAENTEKRGGMGGERKTRKKKKIIERKPNTT